MPEVDKSPREPRRRGPLVELVALFLIVMAVVAATLPLYSRVVGEATKTVKAEDTRHAERSTTLRDTSSTQHP